MQEYYTKIAREGSIIFSSQIVMMLINYLVAVIITRVLGADGYGTYTLALSVVQIAAIFMGFGLGEAIVRYLPFYWAKGENEKAYGLWKWISKFLFINSLILSATVYFLSDKIAVTFFNKPEISLLIKIMSLSYPFSIIGGIAGGYFRAKKNFFYPAVTNNIIVPGVKLLFAVILLLAGWGVYQWSAVYTISLLCTAAVLFFFYKKKVEWKTKVTARPELKELFNFSLPLWFSNLLPLILAQLGILFLGAYRTTEEVGVYKVYVFFASIVAVGMGSLAGIFYPVFSEVTAGNDKTEMSLLYQRVAKWYHLITFTGGILIISIGFWLVPLIFGKDYKISSPLLIYLIVGSHIFNGLTGPDGMALKSMGWTKHILYSSIISFASNFGLSLLLVPEYGMNGAAFAGLISIALSHFYGLGVVKNKSDLKLFAKDSFYITGIGALIFISIIIINNYLITNNLLLQNLSSATVFIIFILLIFYLKVLDKEDIYIIKKFKYKIGRTFNK